MEKLFVFTNIIPIPSCSKKLLQTFFTFCNNLSSPQVKRNYILSAWNGTTFYQQTLNARLTSQAAERPKTHEIRILQKNTQENTWNTRSRQQAPSRPPERQILTPIFVKCRLKSSAKNSIEKSTLPSFLNLSTILAQDYLSKHILISYLVQTNWFYIPGRF